MKNTALRGTIIILAAVALIGALVALRVAQAQQTQRTYTISVTPDKVLESSDSVNITVKVTASRAFDQKETETVYLHIANEDDGDECDIIPRARCANSASRGNGGDSRDFTGDSPLSTTFKNGTTTSTIKLSVTPMQDNTIEDDEKIYLALCTTQNSSECTGNGLLATASIIIVGERIWADNTENSNTRTVALKENQPVAASFTTGSDSNGYRMNNVKLKFGESADKNANDSPSDVSVELLRDNTRAPGAPGELIGALTFMGGSSAPVAGSDAIYTKSEGILLEPNSTYWVLVEGTSGLLEMTRNHSQSVGAIQDGFITDVDTSARGSNWTPDTSQSLKMQVSGIPRGGVVVDTDPETDGIQTALRVDEDRTTTYTVRLDSPPLSDTVVNVMSEDRSIATISPKSLTFQGDNCNSDNCWWKPQEVTVKGGFVSGDPVSRITHEAKEDNIKKTGLPSVALTVREVLVVGPVLGNIDAENATSSHDLSATSTIAQQFRAGDRGYSLTHVQVEFEDGSDKVTDAATVKVCSMQSGEPNLDDCSEYIYDGLAFDGIHTYELEGGKDISARASYYVVVKGTNGMARLTEDTSETASHGWSLGNSHLSKGKEDTDEWMTIRDSVVKVKLIGRSLDAIPTPTPTPTSTATPTPTPTPSGTVTATPTPTSTPNGTVTATPTGSTDATATPTVTPSGTVPATPTATAMPVAGVTPSGLRVEMRTQTTATITWIQGADATGHAVMAIAGGDTKFNLDLDGEARSYTFTGMRQKVYTYYVIASDASGNYRAPDGTLYMPQPLEGPGPPPLDVAPSGLSVLRSGTTAIISWTPGADAARQIVAAEIAGDESSRQPALEIDATASSHAFTGLKQGVYTYHILAFDAYGNYSAPDGSLYYGWVTDE